ncbi:aldehyde dehydrogenase family protein [Sporosarcina thermotolerans]|uniref:Aldehyde dehydrogenase family protein n=1 Tax=Sporosarcina thermotolerans TaxID=633404 RepID=A0AAW9A5H6_9BACL|nr:alpha-ketoglutaric semialdehyde dehydrogenase GucD [Sporosarcina thermotolerans]MDW0116120.1 aldehyde dehydrogenase family protein [Sporosarcina thermotolerans]WHT48089.1 aldehyde dehydrogenase family protein [Sporosarcina thermotolerans]
MTTSTEKTVQTVLNYIDGQWVEASTGQTAESLNPANVDDVVGRYQLSSSEDLDQAVEAAWKAQKEWRKLPGSARGDILFKAADIMEKRIDEIARTMTREMGKTFPEAKGETARGVAILRYYAGEGMRPVGDVIPSTDSSAIMFTTRTPLGVVGVITPWNFPVAIPMWKAAPALIYGNAVVMKPASEAAVTCAKVIDCLHEAGIPAGVINMVTGSGSVVGQGLAEHPKVSGITFTGSNGVGKKLGQLALERGIKYQLEMGGKNPVIVAEDADLDLAVDATISGGLKSTGQKCTATSRVIVHEDVYEEFREKLLAKVAEITVGDGLNEGSWMGPSVSENQLNTVLSYVQKGKEEGAKLLYGGNRCEKGANAKGFFVEPAVFDEVTPDMAIAREEIFGPVLALMKVSSFEEALDVANDSDYGLSASVFTTNISKALSFINEMDAGLVRINAESAGVELQAPFGGMKQSSSHSREQGRAAIEFFTSIKTVFVK